MLSSMTGYGQCEASLGELTIKIEVRSLNSKFLDLNLKLPREFSRLEADIRASIQNHLRRGKINLQVEVVLADQAQSADVNEDLLRAYFHKYSEISKDLNWDRSDLFRLALQSPEVIGARESERVIEWGAFKGPLNQALSDCTNFRRQEGINLSKKLENYISGIRSALTRVNELDGQRIENIKNRVSKNIDEIREKVQVDENRFEQELIYYIEKLDITEEKVRLDRHLEYFMEVMKNDQSEGKKLGFIAQEIGREINTIGSKANDSDIQKVVVEMKDELEKIKEQLLNIL